MQSPFTGKEMILKRERRLIPFRKEEFEVVFQYYLCEKTKEQFTTTELDEVNINQAYNQYRVKYSIPFPDEIKSIREKYAVSAKRMAEILGFGVNSYRQYESGEVPSTSNARLIQTVEDPTDFKRMVTLCNSLEEGQKEKISSHVNGVIKEEKETRFSRWLHHYFLENDLASSFTGYKKPSYQKFAEMVIFFAHTVQPFKTKLNKLLFYADFAMFRDSGYSISGLRYEAIEHGPVPKNYEGMFDDIVRKGLVELDHVSFSGEKTGTRYKGKEPFNDSLFSDIELEVLKKVSNQFAETSSTEIRDISHDEDAWLKHHENKELIPYEYAFNLKHI